MVPENIDRWTFEAVEELCSTGLGESDRHDFKLGLQDPKNTTKICCAFANSVGGFLIYGVRQRSSSFIPEGIEADSEFSAKLRQRIKADPHVDISLPRLVPVPSARKRLIYVFEVPSSARRPHLPSVPEDRFFWKRSNSTCERMTLEEIRYQMLSYEEKKEKLVLLVIDLDVKAARLEALASAPVGSWYGTVFSFDVIDRIVVEAYAFLREDHSIVEKIEQLRSILLYINSQTEQINHFLALSYSPDNKRERIAGFTKMVQDNSTNTSSIIKDIKQKLKELHGIESPYS